MHYHFLYANIDVIFFNKKKKLKKGDNDSNVKDIKRVSL